MVDKINELVLFINNTEHTWKAIQEYKISLNNPVIPREDKLALIRRVVYTAPSHYRLDVRVKLTWTSKELDIIAEKLLDDYLDTNEV